jgi:transaldolase
MIFFIDSADVKEIAELYETGIIDGVTTNPSLMSKVGGDFYKVAKEICAIVDGPVSLEVSAEHYSDMLEEGQKILNIAENVVLKLPMTWDGIKACKHFGGLGASVNMTLCFSTAQALIAAKAGADYVSPFVGRLDDTGHDGLDLVSDINTALSNYPDFDTYILASSIRNPYHFYRVAMIGAHVVTMSGKVIKQLLDHPLTEKGLEIFNSDWKKSGLKI